MNFNLISNIVSTYLKYSQKMNLLSNYDNTLLAMADIEGESWLNKQLSSTEDSPFTVLQILKHLRVRVEEIEENKKDLEIETDPEEIAFLEKNIKTWTNEIVGDAIYGKDGINRWFVRGNGEVVFSKMHSSPEDCKKAEELGFEIF